MSIWSLLNSRFSATFVVSCILVSSFSGFVLSAVVTLDSIKIYTAHEWFFKPKVYFLCKGENITELPDVKEVNVSYNFKGEESWQPLMELTSNKCKRCGFYEKDNFKKDDVYDEWEFCLSDFDDNGKYIRTKDKEFDATFMCSGCITAKAASNSTSVGHHEEKGIHIGLVILISALVAAVFVVAMLVAYKFWQKKKREQDQARFLKLFEEGDDIENELSVM